MDKLHRCRNCRFLDNYVDGKVKCWCFIKRSGLISDSTNCEFKAPKFSY